MGKMAKFGFIGTREKSMAKKAVGRSLGRFEGSRSSEAVSGRPWRYR